MTSDGSYERAKARWNSFPIGKNRLGINPERIIQRKMETPEVAFFTLRSFGRWIAV